MNEAHQLFASSSLGSPKVFRRSLIAALEVTKDSKIFKLNQSNRVRELSTSPIATSPATERRGSILVEALTLPSSNESKRRQDNNRRNSNEYVIQPPKIPLIVRKAIEFIDKNG